ncbi:imidazole glycerol phosphate synthase subunit HisH [Actinopolyspora mortivallis]|uniref:imidazole glycerol phosphate synthase subunit HisH n=1 Tax=Actinopolyspora mortivallis TaxID=33906 RepID=UPI00035ED8B0|nr:imidazole glycerol phosphate synthase subunit HisH [Actinopolyspora mortivallis]
MARVVVLDYGSGNLRSAERALEHAGARVEVTSDHQRAFEADGLVVPGVGAFSACMRGLLEVGGDKVVDRRLNERRPVLGICVGMQILFERGVEHGVEAEGLGRWPGTVERLRSEPLPHMGWNTVSAPGDSALFAGFPPETRFYFVHSFAARDWPDAARGFEEGGQPRLIRAEHGDSFLAAVEDGVLTATQFHPEKSGEAGIGLLRNWLGTL